MLISCTNCRWPCSDKTSTSRYLVLLRLQFSSSLKLRAPTGSFWEKVSRIDWMYVSIGFMETVSNLGSQREYHNHCQLSFLCHRSHLGWRALPVDFSTRPRPANSRAGRNGSISCLRSKVCQGTSCEWSVCFSVNHKLALSAHCPSGAFHTTLKSNQPEQVSLPAYQAYQDWRISQIHSEFYQSSCHAKCHLCVSPLYHILKPHENRLRVCTYVLPGL